MTSAPHQLRYSVCVKVASVEVLERFRKKWPEKNDVSPPSATVLRVRQGCSVEVLERFRKKWPEKNDVSPPSATVLRVSVFLQTKLYKQNGARFFDLFIF